MNTRPEAGSPTAASRPQRPQDIRPRPPAADPDPREFNRHAWRCHPCRRRRARRRPAHPDHLAPTDAIIRISASCVCGSDLWDYRGINPVHQPTPMGHEYVGVVDQVGADVTTITPGQFVVGSFFASDNTCPICQAGYQTSCVHREFVGGAQAEYLRVPLANGTLVATPGIPDEDLIPSLLAASDVLGTGWFGAVAAQADPGKTVAVVGDGAVGLLAVLAAKELGAQRILTMSGHEGRQDLALVGFLLRQARAAHPMMPLDLFRSRTFGSW